jgi:hypothetical protein
VATNRDDGYLVSEWQLHGHTIAKLYKPFQGYAYRLVLKDAGYPTITTISRLNGILWYLRERMNIENNIEFRLKYNKGFGIGCTPIHTYIVIDGRKFRVNTVELVIDMNNKRLLAVYVNEDAEVQYIIENRSLEKVRKAYREINRLVYEIRLAINNIYIYQKDWNKALEYATKLDEIKKRVDDSAIVEEDGVVYGVYVKRMENALKLIDIAKELRELYREVKQTLAYTMLTQ